MGHAKERDVCNLVELPADGRIDLRMTMTVNVAPQAADTVDVPSPVNVDQRASFSPLDQQRLVVGHLRKRVPDVLLVPAFQVSKFHVPSFTFQVLFLQLETWNLKLETKRLPFDDHFFF